MLIEQFPFKPEPGHLSNPTAGDATNTAQAFAGRLLKWTDRSRRSYFRFDPSVRKLVNAANSAGSLNELIRRRLKTKG